MTDEQYMLRCLQLASQGKGAVSPNPLVGAVIVHQGKIIGEGYHRKYGQAHAEVNAVNSVQDQSLLRESTLYVSLEPCSHHGKTPPCSQLVIDKQIPKVVMACLDPFPAVSGRGMRMLQEAGVEVVTGVLEKEALLLNKEFITAQLKKKPYIYLKWAQSADGYMDRHDAKPAIISNHFTQIIVHKLRAEVDAIMVGTNTAVKDNPSLTTRLWHGHNPTRIVLDRSLRIPTDSKIYNGEAKTYIFTEIKKENKDGNKVKYVNIDFDNNLAKNLLEKLQAEGINSILVEGGSQLLQTLIDAKIWDEAFVETNNEIFESGTQAPSITGNIENEKEWFGSKHSHLSNSLS